MDGRLLMSTINRDNGSDDRLRYLQAEQEKTAGGPWLEKGLKEAIKITKNVKRLQQQARINQEKSRETSILKVVFPQSIAGEYHHTSAHLWGEPEYGGKIEANIVYLGGTGCSESDFRDLERAQPKNLITHNKAEGISYFKAPYILMIDRGGCNFVPKVRRAQQFGASAVLIADHFCLCSEVESGECHSPEKECETHSPLMADDGSGGDVTIPSFLIWNTEAMKVIPNSNKSIQ
jgi:hypothetical protein